MSCLSSTSSQDWYERARHVMPGGVNSPVRAFTAVGGTPVFMRRAQGARMESVDGKSLIDFCGSWGPLILGHAREEVVAAIRDAAAAGTSFGTNTPREVELGERLCAMVPALERVRLVNSGTEAVMTALRVARGATGRSKILKFDGCYHGHADYLLVSAGSGLLTGGRATSAGVSAAAAGEVLVAPYNDLAAVERVTDQAGDELAAVIVEPIAGNMGYVPPEAGFLEGLRRVTDRCGAVLIFDEVITGFRFAPTAYSTTCGVTPDLMTLGKIIGGGMPIGAVGGRAELMEQLAPLGPVYQAGTLSGNPVGGAAGLATLDILEREDPYPRLESLGASLREGVNALAREAGRSMHAAGRGSVFTPFFTSGPVRNLADAKQCDVKAHAAFFHGMLERGIYLPPSQFELGFISAAHADEDIRVFLDAASEVLADR